MTTNARVARYHEINSYWFIVPFSVSDCKHLNVHMHGLILETSTRQLAGSLMAIVFGFKSRKESCLITSLIRSFLLLWVSKTSISMGRASCWLVFSIKRKQANRCCPPWLYKPKLQLLLTIAVSIAILPCSFYGKFTIHAVLYAFNYHYLKHLFTIQAVATHLFLIVCTMVLCPLSDGQVTPLVLNYI